MSESSKSSKSSNSPSDRDDASGYVTVCDNCSEEVCRCCKNCGDFPCWDADECIQEDNLVYPYPISSYPKVATGIIECTRRKSIMKFGEYVPYNEEGRLTKWYVDHIHPLFVAREFVLKNKWVSCEIPNAIISDLKKEGLYEKIFEVTNNQKVDSSIDELIMLENMGYTRWKEVRKIVELSGSFDIESLHSTKRFVLRDLGIID